MILPDNSPTTTDTALVELRAVAKRYDVNGREVHALRGVDLQVRRGEFLALVGRSGCGKSTLLNLLGGLDRPTAGAVCVAGEDVARFNEKQLTRHRRDVVGIVFQFFNLLPLLTVLENASLPALLAGKERAQTLQRAEELLCRIGLSERLHQQVSLLSGGEMQRVALARALINDPLLILADEPTGNLDSRSAASVLEALQNLAQSAGKTVVMVTHSAEAAAVADTVREMRDGEFV
jgi:ABC-type lipoprotein export system ATPase subunit